MIYVWDRVKFIILVALFHFNWHFWRSCILQFCSLPNVSISYHDNIRSKQQDNRSQCKHICCSNYHISINNQTTCDKYYYLKLWDRCINWKYGEKSQHCRKTVHQKFHHEQTKLGSHSLTAKTLQSDQIESRHFSYFVILIVSCF